jgi:hypothetical protein
MAERTLEIALVCEDKAHLHLIQTLADAVVRERLGLAAEAPLDTRRSWRSQDGQPTLKLKDATRLLREKVMPSGRPRYRSRRTGETPERDAAPVLDAYELLSEALDPPDAMIVLTDADNAGDRRRADADLALRSIAGRDAPKIPVCVVGVCDPMAEGWLLAVLAGTEPVCGRRAQAQRVLGFDPCLQPERLCADDRQHHHAKRVARFLLDRDQRQLQQTPIATPTVDLYDARLVEAEVSASTLKGHKACGLTPFIDALEQRYAPVVAP